jgi:TIR domain-containing protein
MGQSKLSHLACVSAPLAVGSAMADIFISYSKPDHALALKLSTFLEAEGWSVWWDKSLGAADLYRDEIMKQLAAARAVISIWTPNSIRSDWVRAEAGRAKAEGKLIPVKTPDVAYADIPLPFGEMHTENVGSTDLIRAAIVGQLAKPAVTPSTLSQITSLFKYNVLTSIGIIGSTITLFANLNGALDLADWARELATHWHEWNQVIWGSLFSLVHLNVPRDVVPAISFIVFTAILTIGVNFSLWKRGDCVNSQQAVERSIRGTAFTTGVVLSFSAWIASLLLIFGGATSSRQLEFGPISVVLYVLFTLGFPLAYLLLVGRSRSWIVIASLLFLVMGTCLLMVPLVNESGSNYWEVGVVIGALFQVCMMAVIIYSPLQQLTRRLAFVVLGVLTLVALSEISKLNLHRYLQHPKASNNLIR